MTSPHSGYPHPQQGAMYYQPSPPPTHVYGAHSPGPGHSPGPVTYNPYMHYPPPHMGPHHQSAGRVNGAARGGGSYAGPRNNLHMYHQNYHHGHPPPPVPPPGPGPPPGPQSYGPHPAHHPQHPLLHAPHPQHPHSPHLAAKFGPHPHPHAYSHTPPYPYPSPTSAGPYSPSWQPQQPQSPLPKQLSMPPSREFSPAYYEPPHPQIPPAPPQPPPPISPTRNSPLAQATVEGDSDTAGSFSAAINVSKPAPIPLTFVEFVPKQLQQQQRAGDTIVAIRASELEANHRGDGTHDENSSLAVAVEAPGDTVQTPSSTASQALESSEPAVDESAVSSVVEPAAIAAVVNDSSLIPVSAPAAAPTSSIPPDPPTIITAITYTMGTIPHPSSIPLSPTHSTVSISSSSRPTRHRNTSSTSVLKSEIAIWSRRPGDPSKAPGIIISPRAKPPTDIIEKALESRTPPLSPIIPSSALPAVSRIERTGISGEREKDTEIPAVQIAVKHQHRVQGHQTQAINEDVVESENVTEVTDVMESVLTIPGSPVSTSTSLSIAAGVKDTAMNSADITSAVTQDEADEAQDTAKMIKTTSAPVTVKFPSSSATTSTATTTTTSSTTTTLTTTTTPTSVPTPTKAGPPKSWASLFASSSPSASTSNPNQRPTLPTSSVVGISIPAVPSSSTTAPPIPGLSGKKNELLSLLTHGPGAATSAGPGVAGTQKELEKIRTRGLINLGNMCFANAVLQVLVYCAPFRRLFVELGKLLTLDNTSTGAGSSSGAGAGTSTVANGVIITQHNGSSHHNTGNGKQQKSQTPFIDATVDFLREFIEDEGNTRRRKDALSGGFSQPTRKGKEREIFSASDFDEVDGEGNEEKDEWPESFLPSYVYDAMKEKKRFETMRGGQQEDAEEFLGFYLDTLEEELLHIQNLLQPPPLSSASKVKQLPVEEKEEPEPPEEDGWLEVGKKNRMIVTRTIKAVESPITRMFGGKFKSTLKAAGQKDSVLVEDWRSLRLDIQRDTIHTIQEALTHITHPQPIQMTNASRPGVTIDASQRVLIDALPPVLVLHVKRFCYDTAVGGVVKVMKQVRFEPELEISPDMMAPSGKRPQATKYRLFGAIYHHGHSASGGHYTLDVLHPNRYPGAKIREGWVRIDDELVSDVRSEDVFDAWEKEKDEMRNAYLLFYRRIRTA